MRPGRRGVPVRSWSPYAVVRRHSINPKKPSRGRNRKSSCTSYLVGIFPYAIRGKRKRRRRKFKVRTPSPRPRPKAKPNRQRQPNRALPLSHSYQPRASPRSDRPRGGRVIYYNLFLTRYAYSAPRSRGAACAWQPCMCASRHCGFLWILITVNSTGHHVVLRCGRASRHRPCSPCCVLCYLHMQSALRRGLDPVCVRCDPVEITAMHPDTQPIGLRGAQTPKSTAPLSVGQKGRGICLQC